MSDKYWAEIAARKAAGQKITVEDAMAGKVQMDLMRGLARDAGIDEQTESNASHGGTNWLAIAIIILLIAGCLLFYVLPAHFLSAIEKGRIARALFLGLAMIASYGGLAFLIWWRITSSRTDALERELRYAEEDRKMQAKADLVWNDWGELRRLYHNSFTCSHAMHQRLLARIVELGGNV